MNEYEIVVSQQPDYSVAEEMVLTMVRMETSLSGIEQALDKIDRRLERIDRNTRMLTYIMLAEPTIITACLVALKLVHVI